MPSTTLRAVAIGFGLLCALALPVTEAQAQSRLALVIGNGGYRHVAVLKNPTNDASDVAASLGRLGFAVSKVENADFDAMRLTLLDFGQRARDAEIAIVYFAGHGMEIGGENWLIPVDAELRSDADSEHEAISLRSVISTVARASKLGLVVLDACRDNPFAARIQGARQTRTVGRGLARVEPRGSVLVAYAARDGTTALDGDRRNSPFTAALLQHIETPDLEINFLFRNVRDDVMAATKRAQEPFVYGSLSRELVYLRIAGVVPAVVPPVTTPVQPAVGIFLPTRAPKSLTAAEERALRPRDGFRECEGCPEMVVVPAGSFMLGSPAGEEGRLADEGPQTRVTISRAFAVGKFEVTRAQYELFVRAAPHRVEPGCHIWSHQHRTWDRRTAYTFKTVGFPQDGNHPVVCVSWEDAKAFVAWLQRSTGKPYRLLTEAEWEYAARAGTTTPFSLGVSISTAQANFDGNATYSTEGKGVWRQRTVPVDSFEPNPWGLYNMHGNVWEWVEDCYAREDYKYLPAAVRDGGGAWPGSCKAAEHSFRGGSWLDDPGYLRSARRAEWRPGGRYSYLGFRVARTIEE